MPPRALRPAFSRASTSACLMPAKVCEPSPATRPSLSTMTAPTHGLGEAKPTPWRASSRRGRRNASSCSRLLAEAPFVAVEGFRDGLADSRATVFFDGILCFYFFMYESFYGRSKLPRDEA